MPNGGRATDTTRARRPDWLPWLTTVLGPLIAAQAILGLAMPTLYRDAEWIRATWFGNDWISLIVVTPLLLASCKAASAGSVRAELVCLGTLGYAVYNYAFYLFGAALNAFLPLYVVILGVAILALASHLAHVEPVAVARSVRPKAATRLAGAYLIFIATGLTLVWIVVWSGYVFAGRPTPVAPEAFKIVAALDLLWLVPCFAAGGALLWKGRPWGFVIAAAASVQGALYLLVLSVNSIVAIRRGLADPPGEFPIWGTLTLLTSIAVLVLFSPGNHRRN